MMGYNETLDYLFTKLPMFQRSGPAAYKNSLGNTLKLDEVYGYPHKKFKSIHVAGTNGKGSVSHMLAAILQKGGYKTGLYTSPHLKNFRERIRVDGDMIPERNVVDWVEDFRRKNRELKLEPSFFELTVAMAFDYFSQQHVDISIVEVGLGGKLDSTNIINPEISIITNIGLDHTNFLGNTLGEIALEKAGIIKHGIPVVIGEKHQETEKVFREKAKEMQAPIYFAGKEYKVEYALLSMDGKQELKITKELGYILPNLKLDLLGSYQHHNLPAVLKTVALLKQEGWDIQDKAIYDGLANVTEETGLLGRWQVIGYNPLVVCDTAHNMDGISSVVRQINNTAHKNLHIVFGTVVDKDPNDILRLLPKNAIYYFAKASIPRALDTVQLKEKAFEVGLKGRSYESVSQAFEAAKSNAQKEDMIFVGGSTFIVAEIL